MSTIGPSMKMPRQAGCLQLHVRPAIVNGRNRAHVDPGYRDDFPITAISWLDAIAFANALSEKEELTPVYYEDALPAPRCSEVVSVRKIRMPLMRKPSWP